jgi:putative chitinase
MSLIKKYSSLFEKYGVVTPLQQAHFMAQIHHESGLKPISENLNYSAARLRQVFPKYFPNPAKANLYARKPQAIANRVYANRMGNGNEASGDAWRYRGRGFIQLTGKSNYQALSRDTGIDFVNNPDLLLQEANAMLGALWFWQRNKLSPIASADDIRKVTRIINGGQNGIEHRIQLLTKYKSEIA